MFKPITTVKALNQLDSDLMVSGYRAGYKNLPDYTQRDQSYWHGYLNGQVDGHHMQKSDEQRILAREVVRYWRAH